MKFRNVLIILLCILSNACTNESNSYPKLVALDKTGRAIDVYGKDPWELVIPYEMHDHWLLSPWYHHENYEGYEWIKDTVSVTVEWLTLSGYESEPNMIRLCASENTTGKKRYKRLVVCYGFESGCIDVIQE